VYVDYKNKSPVLWEQNTFVVVLADFLQLWSTAY